MLLSSNVVEIMVVLSYPCFPWEIMVDLMLWLKHCHTHVFPNGLSNIVVKVLSYPCFPWEIG